MARGGQAAREASVPPRPTLRGLRAGTGASDDRARAGTQAGAALPPLSPCRGAAAADGARRTRSGRAGSVERRPDRAAGEWPLGRRHAPPLVEVAPPCAEGRPRRARSRLSAVRPIKACRRNARRVEVLGWLIWTCRNTSIDGRERGDERHGRRRCAAAVASARRCAPGTSGNGGSI